jgi:hypothetical protein
MNPPSGLRQQQQQQKQKTLRMQKHENTLEFHSRLIEAAEGTVSARCSMFFRSLFNPGCGKTRTKYQVRKQFLASSCATWQRKRLQGLKPSTVLGPCGTTEVVP